MPDTEITKLRDQDAWIVQRQDGAVGFGITRALHPGRNGGMVEVLEVRISGRFGDMSAHLPASADDWRARIQLLDAGYFFGKILGHDAWAINLSELHRGLAAEIRARAADPAEAERICEDLPEAIKIILQGRDDIPAEIAAVFPEDWDETLVPRRLRTDLAELWDDYWRPFKAQMKAEMTAGLLEPGRAVTGPAEDAAERHDEIEADIEEEAVGLTC